MHKQWKESLNDAIMNYKRWKSHENRLGGKRRRVRRKGKEKGKDHEKRRRGVKLWL